MFFFQSFNIIFFIKKNTPTSALHCFFLFFFSGPRRSTIDIANSIKNRTTAIIIIFNEEFIVKYNLQVLNTLRSQYPFGNVANHTIGGTTKTK
jgi:hypothetical protein